MDESEPGTHKLKGLTSVSLLTLVSRITGLARDALMASIFGAGPILDAFTVAFRLPNTFRRLFGEGVMTAAFLPEFVRAGERHGPAAATALFSDVAWRLLKILAVLTVILEVLLATAYLSVEMSDRSALLCELSLIMTPYLVLICMAGHYSAALHGMRHFVYPALTPILLNLMWLTGGLFAAWVFASGYDEVRLIAAIILLAGFAQLGILIYKTSQYGIRISLPRAGPDRNAKNTDADKVFRAMAPVLLGLSITQVNSLVDSFLAWVLMSDNLNQVPSMLRFQLPEGTAGALYLGQRLFTFPLGVFAVALGTVLFPRFAQHAQTGNHAELNRDVIHGLQLVLVVGIPASVGLWFMAAPITDLLFRYGQFDATAADLTYRMIAAYSTGVWIFSGLLIVNRVFYAAGDQVTPMRQGLICVGLNLMFDFLMLPVFGGPALPLASVLATLFQLGLALEVLRKRFLTLGRSAFVPLLWRVAVCTLVMTGCSLGMLSLMSRLESSLATFSFRFLSVCVPVCAAVIVYTVGLTVCGIRPDRLLKEPHVPA
ncbi:MAG: murein biosynthesis integral membrane protein MurJ [Fuerstiella sp.]